MEQKECGYRVSSDQVDSTQSAQQVLFTLFCIKEDCELSIIGRVFQSSNYGSIADKRSEALLAAQNYRKLICPILKQDKPLVFSPLDQDH